MVTSRKIALLTVSLDLRKHATVSLLKMLLLWSGCSRSIENFRRLLKDNQDLLLRLWKSPHQLDLPAEIAEHFSTERVISRALSLFRDNASEDERQFFISFLSDPDLLPQSSRRWTFL